MRPGFFIINPMVKQKTPVKLDTPAQKKKRRVNLIVSWLIQGMSDRDINMKIQEDFEVKGRQARNYMRLAYEEFKPSNEIDIESRRSKKITELIQLKETLKKKHKGTPAGINAITRVENLIIKLEGIMPPKLHEHNHDGEVDIKHAVLNIDPLIAHDQTDDSSQEDIKP